MNNWIEVAKVDDIPVLGARTIEINNIVIAVFRNSSDQVFALKDECPHKKGPLSQGIVHGTTVTCPLHNWKISLENGEAIAPDEGCANTFETMIKEGVVYINI